MRLRRVEPARIARLSVVLVAASALASQLGGVGSAASVVGGGAFMLADFHLIRVLVSRLITVGTSRGWVLILLSVKFLLVLALLGAVMLQWPVAPLSFAWGASMLLVAALADATLLGEPLEPEAV